MISIAMTTYNGECFLREQIDSILKQNVVDWELIICDDCSTDSTWDILNEYNSKDPRIKIFRNEINLGFKKNFEKAISLCKGEFIALSDQDDIWEINHLEKLLENIKGKSVASGNACIIDGNGNKAEYLLSDGDKYFVDGDDVDKLFAILCYRNPFFGAISLYKTGKLFDVAIPIPEFVTYHDLWFSAIACCLDGINYTYEPLIEHRIHGKNESGVHHITIFEQIKSTLKNDRKDFSIQRIQICDELLKRIPDISNDKKEIISIIKNYHKYRLNGNRLKTISFMRRYYKKIFSTSNYKQFISRCIGVLISG